MEERMRALDQFSSKLRWPLKMAIMHYLLQLSILISIWATTGLRQGSLPIFGFLFKGFVFCFVGLILGILAERVVTIATSQTVLRGRGETNSGIVWWGFVFGLGLASLTQMLQFQDWHILTGIWLKLNGWITLAMILTALILDHLSQSKLSATQPDKEIPTSGP